MPDQVARARSGDDREQPELGDDPTLTTGTECWESGAHRQMLPTRQVMASETRLDDHDLYTRQILVAR